MCHPLQGCGTGGTRHRRCAIGTRMALIWHWHSFVRWVRRGGQRYNFRARVGTVQAERSEAYTGARCTGTAIELSGIVTSASRRSASGTPRNDARNLDLASRQTNGRLTAAGARRLTRDVPIVGSGPPQPRLLSS
jgi:hypothetical protein